MKFESAVSICSFDNPELNINTPAEFCLTNFLKPRSSVTTNMSFCDASVYISLSSVPGARLKSRRICFTDAFLLVFLNTWGFANAESKSNLNFGDFFRLGFLVRNLSSVIGEDI